MAALFKNDFRTNFSSNPAAFRRGLPLLLLLMKTKSATWCFATTRRRAEEELFFNLKWVQNILRMSLLRKVQGMSDT